MAGRRVNLNAKGWQRLMGDLRGLPAEPVGPHLADDEFVDYATGGPAAEASGRMEAHLASCARCAAEVERLLVASEAWRRAEGQRRLAEQRRRALGATPLRERLAGLLGGVVLSASVALESPQAAFAAPLRSPTDGQTEDGLLRWRLVPDEAGNLIVRLGSHALELEHARLRLSAGGWQRDVVLRRVTPDQVGAEAVITREERAGLTGEAALRVEAAPEQF